MAKPTRGPKDTPGYEGEIKRAKELKKEHSNRGISMDQARAMARVEIGPANATRFVGWDGRNYPMFYNDGMTHAVLRSGGTDLPDEPFELLPGEGVVV